MTTVMRISVSTMLHSLAVKISIFVPLLIPTLTLAAEDAAPKFATANPSPGGFDAAAAERFAKLALACVEKEYPNKISHV